MEGTKSLTADRVLGELKRCGVSHVVFLPDTEARFMYEAVIRDPDLRLIQICREGEAIGRAAGLQLGGKEPVVLHQSTGFFESGDSVRGIALDLKMPLLLMIGYRGYRGGGASPNDSAAVFIEPILKAWGRNYYIVESDEDGEKISVAHREAHELSRPVAILITGEYA